MRGMVFESNDYRDDWSVARGIDKYTNDAKVTTHYHDVIRNTENYLTAWQIELIN